MAPVATLDAETLNTLMNGLNFLAAEENNEDPAGGIKRAVIKAMLEILEKANKDADDGPVLDRGEDAERFFCKTRFDPHGSEGLGAAWVIHKKNEFAEERPVFCCGKCGPQEQP